VATAERPSTARVAATPTLTILSPAPYTTYVADSTSVSLVAKVANVVGSPTCTIEWGDGTTNLVGAIGKSSPYYCATSHVYHSGGLNPAPPDPLIKVTAATVGMLKLTATVQVFVR